MEVFKLFGSIFVNTDEADASLSKTEDNAESVATKLGNGVKTAAKWGTAVVGAAAAVGTAMVNTAKDTASNLDVIDKTSQRMEMTAEDYQKLAYAADLCGVSTSQLESASKKLKANMGDDADLTEYIKTLADMDDSVARNELAVEYFGSAVAQDLIPMLNAGGDSIDSMMQEAEDLGLVMSNDTVAAGATLNDSFTKVSDTITAIGNTLGASLMPVVQELLDFVLENAPMLQEMIGEITPIISELAATILPPLAELAQTILPVIMDVLTPILSLLTSILGPLVELISGILGPLVEMLGSLLSTALQPLIPVIQTVANVLISVLGGAFEAMKPIITTIEDMFSGLITFITGVFTGDWQKAWSGVVEIFSGIFNGIKDIVKGALNTVIGFINGVFSKLGSIDIPDWVPIIGGSTFSLPQIPLLANGGTLTSSGNVIVGEQGPELLSLPSGATVTPLSGDSSVIDYGQLASAIVGALSGVQLVAPVYIGTDKIDEQVSRAIQSKNYRSGGR